MSIYQGVLIKVFGQVQGVFFRSTAKQKAQQMGLVGEVCNQADGTVHIIAEGPDKTLRDFIDWCYNGVDLAKVEKIDVWWRKPTGQYQDFKIK
jgi:acylphosphatase